MRSSAIAILLAGYLLAPAHAALVITDGTLGFSYDTDVAADDGNMDLTVGGADLGYGEGWFLTVGGVTTELMGGTFTSLSASEGLLSFAGVGVTDLDVELFYGITEVIPGEAGFLVFDAVVANTGTARVNGTLSNYVDFDLPTESDDDEGFLDLFSPDVVMGAFDAGSFVEQLYEVPDRYEIGEFDDLYFELLDSDPLDDTDNGFTVGDFTGAAQWDFSLGEGDEVAFFGDTRFDSTAVPEPGSLMLLSISGIAGFFVRRRR